MRRRLRAGSTGRRRRRCGALRATALCALLPALTGCTAGDADSDAGGTARSGVRLVRTATLTLRVKDVAAALVRARDTTRNTAREAGGLVGDESPETPKPVQPPSAPIPHPLKPVQPPSAPIPHPLKPARDPSDPIPHPLKPARDPSAPIPPPPSPPGTPSNPPDTPDPVPHPLKPGRHPLKPVRRLRTTRRPKGACR